MASVPAWLRDPEASTMIDPPSTARPPPPRPSQRRTKPRTRPYPVPLLAAVLLVAMLVGFLSPEPVSAEERAFFYGYDRLGRPVSATDGVTKIDYVYDAGGNLLSRTAPLPGSVEESRCRSRAS